MARRADSHCTCCGSTQAFPARLRVMMSGPRFPTLALGRTRSPRCTERLEQRAAHDVFDIPTTNRQRAQVIGDGGHVGARARSASGAERAARGRDRAAEGARARSAPMPSAPSA